MAEEPTLAYMIGYIIGSVILYGGLGYIGFRVLKYLSKKLHSQKLAKP